MKITVKGNELANAVGQVRAVTGKKSALQALSCILLVPNKQDMLTLSGTDLSQSLSVTIPMVPTVSDGEVMVSAEKFAAISKALIGSEAVKLATSETFVLAVGGTGGKFTLSGLNPVEWPGMLHGKASEPFGVNGGFLAEALRGVHFAADLGDARGLSSICLQISQDNKITMAASDGSRMAFLSMPTDSTPVADQRVILPLDSARTIINLFERSSSVMIECDGSILTILNDNMIYSTRTMATAFPKWEGIIPQSYEHGIELSREAMVNALRGVLLIQDDRPYSVTLTFASGNVNVKAISQAGSHEEDIPITVERGGTTVRRFNAKMLLDWLEQVPTETFKMELPKITEGVVQFKAEGASGYVCIPLTLDGARA